MPEWSSLLRRSPLRSLRKTFGCSHSSKQLIASSAMLLWLHKQKHKALWRWELNWPRISLNNVKMDYEWVFWKHNKHSDLYSWLANPQGLLEGAQRRVLWSFRVWIEWKIISKTILCEVQRPEGWAVYNDNLLFNQTLDLEGWKKGNIRTQMWLSHLGQGSMGIKWKIHLEYKFLLTLLLL